MVYFKYTNEDGFLTVSTLNANEGGNCSKLVFDTIADMYRNAEPGYGVKEENGRFVYAQRPISEELEVVTEEDLEEALSILLGTTSWKEEAPNE